MELELFLPLVTRTCRRTAESGTKFLAWQKMPDGCAAVPADLSAHLGAILQVAEGGAHRRAVDWVYQTDV